VPAESEHVAHAAPLQISHQVFGNGVVHVIASGYSVSVL
jgi:hypothetical protein